MKKLTSVVMALLVLLTFIPLSSAEEYDNVLEYQGIQTYQSLYNNVNFTDIKNHWAKDSIYRMASLSVIRGMGKSNFSPNGTLTKDQALALIVRIMGLEGEAQVAGEESMENADTGGYKIFNTNDYWANGYIQVAVNNNIVTQEEVTDIETLSDNEDNQISLELERNMAAYEANPNLTDAQIRNIETQLREKLKKRYTWESPVSREQVAVWIGRALGLEPIYGDAQQSIYNLKDWQQFDTKNLPLVEAVLQRGIMIGDEKGYFRPKSSLKRGEMAKLLDNIHEEIMTKQGYNIAAGTVRRIDAEVSWINGKEINRKKYMITNDADNSIVNLITQDSSDETHRMGFIVYKDGKLLTHRDIKGLDYIKYYINPEGRIVFAEILPKETSLIEGFIEEVNVDDNTIIIKDYDDKIYKLKVLPSADIKVNNEYAELKDLLYGQEVSLQLSDGNVIDIEGYIDIEEEGYIHPGERIYIGKVLYVDTEDGILTVMENDKQTDFVIEPYTPVIKDDVHVGLTGIREGDIVRLEFDQYKGNVPIKVYIAEPDRQIRNLYKSTITQFNPMRNELILSGVSYYENANWLDKSTDMRLNLSYDSKIYFNGREITKEALGHYLGREAYIATEDNYGKEEALKIVIKSGYEKKYYNSIQEIAFGDSKLRVDYNEMYFDESTIIIKDGKLIHPYNLREDDDVFVISQGIDTYTAAFISVESIEDNGMVVYRGRIDEIGEYSFELDDFDILEGTDWDYSSRQQEFNISEDTQIIDTRDETPVRVSVKEFTDSRFLREDDRRDNYYKEYVYAVEWNDMVLALNIIDDDNEAQVITTANVKSIDRTNDSILIENVRDWSDFEGKWNINSVQINLDVRNAIFVKNGRTVDINEISVGDSIYALRKNDQGYVVVVR